MSAGLIWLAMEELEPGPGGIVLRAWLAIWLGTAIMIGAGHLSWLRSNLTGWRFHGPLWGGLGLSGLFFYLIFGRTLLSLW